MKIYFACSIRGGREMAHLYPQIVEELKKYGTVLSELFSDQSLTHLGKEDITEKEIHDRDMDWIKEADFIVAEVSNPSLGVGYEIGKAEEWGKKVLCLYKIQENKRLSAMITGSEKLEYLEYEKIEEVKEFLKDKLN